MPYGWKKPHCDLKITSLLPRRQESTVNKVLGFELKKIPAYAGTTAVMGSVHR